MLYAYQTRGPGLGPLAPDQPLTDAVWIDLYRPLDRQVAPVEALGVEVPTLEDMEEIEISNRLYRDGDSAYMTAVLPGHLPDGRATAMPVTFILSPDRLVTVRHHAPSPFNTFPGRAERSSSGVGSADRIFLGLIEEIIALASRAPSSLNTQPWNFTVVTGEPLDRIREENARRTLGTRTGAFRGSRRLKHKWNIIGSTTETGRMSIRCPSDVPEMSEGVSLLDHGQCP